jgi:signal transduction histidine kinase
LRQLLANAASYSQEGTPIEISATVADASAVISISNAGPAIPGPDLELLFEKFYRGEKVRNRVAGSGLGLSITRDIVAAHGGQIWVKNLPEGGVQFAFTLPAAQCEA